MIKAVANIRFNHPGLLTTALTHRSALNEKKGASVSNERLEFLGDAVLELIVSNYLYRHYPDKPEGDLTHLRANLVQTKTLAAASQKLKLGQFLFLSTGEKASGGQKNLSILADCFEAVIGAIYLDQGLSAATQFVEKNLLIPGQTLLKTAQITDYKSRLQEYWQKTNQSTPVYKIVKATGPEHKKNFKVQVFLNHQVRGQGIGSSKLTAQQQAAKTALERLNQI